MRATLIFGTLLFLAACDLEDLVGPRYTEDFHGSYPLSAAGKLSIETFNGGIELTGWDRQTVQIEGTKYGPSRQAVDDLRIEIVHAPDSIDVRVMRPSNFRGSWGARFRVSMPRKTVLDHITTSNGPIQVIDGAGPARLRTSNGLVRVQNFEGNLDARTSNGPIELTGVGGEVTARTSNARIRAESLNGAIEAVTSNGGITAELSGSPANHPLRLETSNAGVDLRLSPNFESSIRINTSNGPITLRIPDGINAQLLARTSNGSITSDFDLKVHGEMTRTHLDGTIGNGGPLFDLATSNGSIRLLRM